MGLVPDSKLIHYTTWNPTELATGADEP